MSVYCKIAKYGTYSVFVTRILYTGRLPTPVSFMHLYDVLLFQPGRLRAPSSSSWMSDAVTRLDTQLPYRRHSLSVEPSYTGLARLAVSGRAVILYIELSVRYVERTSETRVSATCA